jgi:protein-arginine kinase
VSISVSGVTTGDGEEPPPIVKAIMNAMSGFVSDLEKAAGEAEAAKKEPELVEFPCARAEAPYRIGEMLHLEGLHLIGELEPVGRALRALKMKLVGVDADGVRDSGHVYRLFYEGSQEAAKRVAEDILREERNARVRLFEEMPRVFGDSLCRALAILKNCRLLSPGELFDLLSPLRLAAIEKMLDGIDLAGIETLISSVDLTSKEDNETQESRDRMDAERADEMNRRFEDVVLNERAEEKFL